MKFGAIFEALAAGLRMALSIFQAKNAPDVKNAAKRQDEANARAAEANAVKNKDADQIRKNLSE